MAKRLLPLAVGPAMHNTGFIVSGTFIMAAIALTLTFVLQKKDKAACDIALQIIANQGTTKTLSEARAYDCDFFSDQNSSDLQSHYKDLFHAAELKADICVQQSASRRKKLLICDMDSTLIGQECIDELADFIGAKDRVSAITQQAMRGEIDFNGALEQRVKLLKGLDLSILQKCFDTRINLNEGARALCQTMKHHGAKTVIVSGGFTFFTQRIAQACGFEHHHANVLLNDGQQLTGEVGMPILGRAAKLDALRRHSQDLGGPQTAIAIGDGANDLAMITAAGLGIAYDAKPAVAAAAHCEITYADLRTALYYQGFSDNGIINS
ncbi:MAG: phosphoserine phosphatase SerB [Litorimonas sp.]